jgi:hypothetical protein
MTWLCGNVALPSLPVLSDTSVLYLVGEEVIFNIFSLYLTIQELANSGCSLWQEGKEGKERLMSATVKQGKNRHWGMLPGDQRTVTSPQRLKRLMK